MDKLGGFGLMVTGVLLVLLGLVLMSGILQWLLWLLGIVVIVVRRCRRGHRNREAVQRRRQWRVIRY